MPEKKQYAVTLPVAGSVIVFVEAENKEEAIDKALGEQNWRVVGSENTEAGGEWVSERYLLRGNVSRLPCSEAYVEES